MCKPETRACLQSPALQEALDEKHLGFMDGREGDPVRVRQRRQPPGQQGYDAAFRGHLEQGARNDARHVTKLHGIAACADVIIDDEPLPVRIEPYVGVFAGEARLANKKARLDLAPRQAAQRPLALFEPVRHDLKGKLGRTANGNAAGMAMGILHEDHAVGVKVLDSQ